MQKAAIFCMQKRWEGLQNAIPRIAERFSVFRRKQGLRCQQTFEQGTGAKVQATWGGHTSAALLPGTEYRARNKFDILARGPLVPCSCPLAGSPCLKPSARLSAPHLRFPNIPSPAPIAQSCLAAVGPAAPGAHLQRLQAARLVAFWTLLVVLRANWRIC
jgi:hypothetical protein